MEHWQFLQVVLVENFVVVHVVLDEHQGEVAEIAEEVLLVEVADLFLVEVETVGDVLEIAGEVHPEAFLEEVLPEEVLGIAEVGHLVVAFETVVLAFEVFPAQEVVDHPLVVLA